MKRLVIEINNKNNEELVNKIIKNEYLDVKVSKKVNSLGDNVMIISGDNEEIETLEDVYNMVKC